MKILNLKILANNFAQNLEILRYFEFWEITLLKKKKLELKIIKKLKCHQRPQEKIPQKPKSQKSQEKRKESSHSQYISTEYWNKFTQKLESQRDPCPSWTHSSTISSRKSPLNHQNLLDTTRSKLSHQEKSKPPSDFFFQENLPSTPSQREPKPSPNIQLTHEYQFHEFYVMFFYKCLFLFKKFKH